MAMPELTDETICQAKKLPLRLNFSAITNTPQFYPDRYG
jgi:hypothetical protein